MKINDIADKAYCISLEKRPDRWAGSKKQFEDNNIIVEKFVATDGSLLGPIAELSNGEVGALNSHRRVLANAIENDLECIAVFEDDAYFVENFEVKFQEYYDQVPSDWEFLYLGFNRYSGPVSNVSDKVFKLHNAYSAHAFLIKKNAIKYSYNLMLNDSFPADVYYALAQSAYPAYGPVDALAGQKSGFSDIAQHEVNYDWIYGL